MYGRPNGQPLTETRPYAAHTKKGTLRARMARELLAAHQAGRVQVAIGRASDYFGPRGGAQSNLGDRVIPAALAGKTATVLGDPDQPHTYTYLPDIGEGLAVLGEHPDAPGEVWHLPNDPHTQTTRQLVDTIYRQAGQPKTKLRGTPVLVLRALGVINPTVRELVELQYEFQEPFIVDSTKIAAKLDVHATPLDQALAETRRVLRPGGRLRFYEHVRATDPRLARWQDRLQHPWGWLVGGCHPNRDTVAAITAAGLRLVQLDRFDLQAMPPLARPHVLGVAEWGP